MWEASAKNASWEVQHVFQASKYFEKAGLEEDEFRKMQQFSTKKMYRLLQREFTKVRWRKLVCNKMDFYIETSDPTKTSDQR